MRRLSPRLERLLAAAGLAAAFLIMASIFVPLDSGAASAPGTAGLRDGGAPPRAVPHDAGWSTNPHEGLPLLGCIEHGEFVLWIYGGGEAPRYSIYDADGRERGILLRAEQVAERFPGLDPEGMRFHLPVQLMHVDPMGASPGW